MKDVRGTWKQAVQLLYAQLVLIKGHGLPCQPGTRPWQNLAMPASSTRREENRISPSGAQPRKLKFQ